MRPKLRLLLVSAVVLFSLLINFWLGEHNAQLVPLAPLVVLMLAMCLSSCLTWRASRVLALCLSLLVLFGGVQAWLRGSKEHAFVLNDCLERCAHLQLALDTYRRSYGVYPVFLEDLSGHLPAQIILPPQILKYERTQDGYVLWIADEMMSYQGTQSKEFGAHK
jgi:hypothetical protein